MNWFRKLTGPSRVARVEAQAKHLRADLDIAHRAIAIARRDTAVAVASVAEWQTYVKGLAKVVMAQDREIAELKARVEDAPAGYDVRLARIEMLLMGEVSDGVVELSEAAERALERALRDVGKEVVS